MRLPDSCRQGQDPNHRLMQAHYHMCLSKDGGECVRSTAPAKCLQVVASFLRRGWVPHPKKEKGRAGVFPCSRMVDRVGITSGKDWELCTIPRQRALEASVKAMPSTAANKLTRLVHALAVELLHSPKPDKGACIHRQPFVWFHVSLGECTRKACRRLSLRKRMSKTGRPGQWGCFNAGRT